MTFRAFFDQGYSNKPDEIETIDIKALQSFVISRKENGKALSLFRDDQWDLRPYGAEATYSFVSWHTGKEGQLFRLISDELRMIAWLLFFAPNANKKSVVKANSLKSYFTALRGLAKIAYRTGIPLAEAHSNDRFQIALKSSVIGALEYAKFTNREAGTLKSIIEALNFYCNHEDIKAHCKWRITPEDELSNLMAKLTKNVRVGSNTRKQTPLIPTRILSNLLSEIEEKLGDFYHVKDNFVEFYQAIHSDQRLFADSSGEYGNNGKRVHKSLNKSNSKRPLTSRNETVKMFHLDEFLSNNSCKHDLKNIQGLLTEYQVYCSILIHAYTGMRKNEVSVMPFNAYTEVDIKDFGKVSCILSYTSKSESDNYSEQLLWVTISKVKKAVEVAQAIARCFWAKSFLEEIWDESKTPLWLANNRSNSKKCDHYPYPRAGLHQYRNNSAMRSFNRLENIGGVIIKKEDIDELVLFDAFRDWEQDENFQEGNIWPLSSHMFRRSVAVYSSRSGMVSLPSLGTQYKHLSLTMTALYAENSSFAKSFILKDGKVPESHQVLSEFEAAKDFNQSVKFHESVIKAETKLSGGQGNSIQVAKDRDKLPSIMADPEATRKAISQGRMSYKETVVGGCMRDEVCENYGIDEIVPCVFNCKDAVIGGDHGEKLKNYSDTLAYGLEEMDVGSPAYKATEREINKIKVMLLEDEESS